MLRQPLVAMLIVSGMAAAGCGWKPGSSTAPAPDTCADSDGPNPGTLHQAIAAVPTVAQGSTWIETARGHTRNCRLYWVKLTPGNATASSPEQLLFFDRNTPLGSPTPNPKPYITVLSSGEDTVTVQYQWKVGDELDCCPTGIGTTRYQISKGKLKAVDPIPNQ